MSDGRESAQWQGSNCNYGTCTAGNYVLAGTTLYHAGTPVRLRSENPDQPLLDPAYPQPQCFFTTSRLRADSFGTSVQTFTLKQNLPALYAKTRGGRDFAEDLFRDGGDEIAYFSNKECEVVIQTNYLDQYLKKPEGVLTSIWYFLTCCCRPRR